MDNAQVFVIGRLTSDPKTFGEGDKQRAVFTIAVNRGKGDNRKTSFLDAIAWGRRADIMGDFRKGMGIAVTGDLEQDSYEKDGNRVNRVQINVSSITATTSTRNVNGGGGGSAAEVTVGGEESADIPF